jgi:23S rRNA (cytidine1920-2'-O)/16S rRNA (cytidine1409-2'-O)-methyltransferase
MAMSESSFVSTGGLKLEAAMVAFGLDIGGWTCVDMGANVGGFTDCLIKRGAAKVYSVDTGYGQLAWTLRNHPDVEVMERTNAMRVDPRVTELDLAVIDLGWTRQAHAIPAALRWGPKRLISLIKPQYEQTPPREAKGIWDDASARGIGAEVVAQFPSWGVQVIDWIESPIRGGSGKGKAGNREMLAYLEPA